MSTDNAIEGEHNGSDAEEEEVNLMDLVAEQEARETEANELLGAALDDVCTYPEGYKNRQALYACVDCTGAGNPAALCHGCAINCHEGHLILELYSKRFVCCDCGNSKFKSPCKLFEKKDKLNVRNVYNHNYEGLYCVCNVQYNGEETMYQCIVCEDWLHLPCLTDSPDTAKMDEVAEFVCKRCMATKEGIDFLYNYADENFKESLESEKGCLLKKLKENSVGGDRTGALFFGSHLWRQRLCKCDSCLEMYEKLGVGYLTDVADSTEEFAQENLRQVKPIKEDDIVDELVKIGGRDAAAAVMAGYEDMKAGFLEIIQKKSSEGSTVSKEDVYELFEGLRSGRKRRHQDCAD